MYEIASLHLHISTLNTYIAVWKYVGDAGVLCIREPCRDTSYNWSKLHGIDPRLRPKHRSPLLHIKICIMYTIKNLIAWLCIVSGPFRDYFTHKGKLPLQVDGLKIWAYTWRLRPLAGKDLYRIIPDLIRVLGLRGFNRRTIPINYRDGSSVETVLTHSCQPLLYFSVRLPILAIEIHRTN